MASPIHHAAKLGKQEIDDIVGGVYGVLNVQLSKNGTSSNATDPRELASLIHHVGNVGEAAHRSCTEDS